MSRIPVHFRRKTAYIDRQMTKPDPRQISSVVLFSLSARNREDSILWAELLRRTAPRIKQFIRGTLRLSMCAVSSRPAELQESDLFQSTIVKLVENDCAAMRRFSGTTDGELMAYLAVITRSVVRDCLRRQRARKRPRILIPVGPPQPERPQPLLPPGRIDPSSAERDLLAREIRDISERSLHTLEGKSSDRDRLIFELYFFHDLSLNQIAQCRGINLSKAGVEKVILRLTEHLRAAAMIGVSEATLQ